jgi:hypothetical protein
MAKRSHYQRQLTTHQGAAPIAPIVPPTARFRIRKKGWSNGQLWELVGFVIASGVLG